MMFDRYPALLVAAAAMLPLPAVAEAQEKADSEDAANAALRDEVVRLRAEVEAIRAEMRSLRAEASPVPSAPIVAAQTPAAALSPASNANAVQISWKGAPEFKSEGGWSFKPRGRLQVDGGYLSAPASRAGSQADGRGFTSRVRRAYLGVQGTIPGGFSYRADVDLAGNSVTWTDLYLAYGEGPLSVTVGQHHPFTSLEQIQSDLFLSFNERAAFIGAFNLERRVGISAGYKAGDVTINAGIFTDDVASLTNDGNKSVSFDGRVVWAPKFGATQLHLAGSAHYRKLGDTQAALGTRYRQRPYIATTDIRFVDTGQMTVNRETHYGAEFALNHKRIHLVGEAAWLHADRLGGADPTFFGGYAEAGFFLTNDTRTYKNGTFDRIVPTRPLGDGGFGALELNLRYDRLDLTDAGITGGSQNGFGAGLVWIPTSYVRFMLNYMHLSYDIPGAASKFNADVIGMRSQVDF